MSNETYNVAAPSYGERLLNDLGNARDKVSSAWVRETVVNEKIHVCLGPAAVETILRASLDIPEHVPITFDVDYVDIDGEYAFTGVTIDYESSRRICGGS